MPDLRKWEWHYFPPFKCEGFKIFKFKEDIKKWISEIARGNNLKYEVSISNSVHGELFDKTKFSGDVYIYFDALPGTYRFMGYFYVFCKNKKTNFVWRGLVSMSGFEEKVQECLDNKRR